MLLPRLSLGTTRDVAVGPFRSGLRSTGDVVVYDRFQCYGSGNNCNGLTGCVSGAGSTLANARTNAHENAETACSPSSVCSDSYSGTPC
jgi:hypothetical protein